MEVEVKKPKIVSRPPYENLNRYDKIWVSFSGGKDSFATLAKLLDMGIPKDKIVLTHNLVDGSEEKPLYLSYDWRSTEGYVRAIAKHFGLELCWSWRDKGMQGRLLKYKEKPADILYKFEGGPEIRVSSNRGEEQSGFRFPAKSADLQSRWCSGCLKIDVGRTILSEIYDLRKPRKGEVVHEILFISGERRQESSARSKYDPYPTHPRWVDSNGLQGGRIVHHWRSILDLDESEVWSCMERYKIRPHPAYQLGFSRCSCQTCIFHNNDGIATLMEIEQYKIERLAKTERAFGHTIDNNKTIMEMAAKGTSWLTEDMRKYITDAIEPWGNKSVIMEQWELPAGAFKTLPGPT